MPDAIVTVTVRIPDEPGAGAGWAAARLVEACRRAGVEVTVERSYSTEDTVAALLAERYDLSALEAERHRPAGRPE